ncbi:hypothetical protein Ntsu_04740 [Nocardia sp. IFM 10818]
MVFVRPFIARIGCVTVAALASLWFVTGSASAVSAADCESDGKGWVDVRLDPTDITKGICTCKGGGFYDGLQVFGPHIHTVGNAIYPITCVGLEV